MRTILLTLMLTLPFGFACSDDKGGGDDTGSSGDGGDGGSGDGGDGGGDGVSPEVESADAWCYEHSTGETAFFWNVKAEADDPQGSDTLESFFDDGVVVMYNGAEFATYAMVCDSSGGCSGTFNQSQDGVSCTNANAYEFQISVVDSEGNWSQPFTVQGRTGTDASG